MNRSIFRACRAIIAVAVALVMNPPTTTAQVPVDIGLYPTAVPDSFEVSLQAQSTITGTQGIMNGVFTIRWESSAGGYVVLASISGDCSAYALVDVGDGVITDPVEGPGFKYYSFSIVGLTALSPPCPITTTLSPIGGFKMVGFTGMTIVNIVNDAYTNGNNKDYFLSMGGIDVTGTIISSGVNAEPLNHVPSLIVPAIDAFAPSPNPASGMVHIHLGSSLAHRSRPGQLTVFNSSGALVRTIPLDRSTDGIDLDLRDWSPGLYHLQLMADGKRISECKLMVE